MKGKIFLIHWDPNEAEDLAKPLRDSGWTVEIEAVDGARAGMKIKTEPPDIIVIYLTRLPSHGRETAHWLRDTKAKIDIPIIFVGGKEEAIVNTKAKVPDAIYTTSEELQNILIQISDR